MAGYTKQQQKAIDLRNSNILVSASAGTGKTAVLTERIISILLDKDDPVDIDEMAVVTFTRAAAAEMKERIENKLNAELAKGENSHIRKQIALLPYAQITTLHSLCLNIIRNYFYVADVDPSFTIGDEVEMELMAEEVLEEYLEEKYAEGSPEFIRMAESVASGKNDKALRNIIYDLYKNAESHAWPYRWLSDCGQIYSICSVKDIDDPDRLYASGIADYTLDVLNGAEALITEAMEICTMYPDFDDWYSMLDGVRTGVTNLYECSTYSEYNRGLNMLTLDVLPGMRKKDKNVRDEIKDKYYAARDLIKKLCNEFYYKKPEDICKDIESCKETAEGLCRAAAEYRKKLLIRKQEQNVMDFNDIEHYALEILTKEGSTAAAELREQYRYILVDEYQDINEVQDTIIYEISRQDDGEQNVFMVGDVKQSIYGFRLARPEIFENKRSTYTDSPGPCRRIMLSKNFRSSPAILGTVNFIFSQIMKRKYGKVEYDKTHEFEFEKPASREEYGEPVEVVYISEEGLIESEYNKRKLEAACIADKIKEITGSENPVMINDAKTGEKRPVAYDDIVILLRSMKGWSEEFTEVLMEHQIPVSADEHTGYFSAREIQITLSMLKIIDNPRQDIALAAVLRSVLGGFDDDELARIRAQAAEGDMFTALCQMAENAAYSARTAGDCAGSTPDAGTDDADSTPAAGADVSGLAQKCRDFLDMLNGLREQAPYIRVYELIEKIYYVNGFLLNMKAMAQGERRVANLKMLLDKAADFESTDKRSLFDFMEYVERLKSANVDYGEMGDESTQNGTVRIMSIHNSKGLEFPVVFAAGMGKKPNMSDKNRGIIIHSDMGLGLDVFDPGKRTKSKTLIKRAIARKMTADALGEELRVLYVAFTRAKDKLILTGTISDKDKFFEKCSEAAARGTAVNDNDSYFAWLTPCFMKHPDWTHTSGAYDNEKEYPPMDFTTYSLESFESEEGRRISKKEAVKRRLLDMLTTQGTGETINRYMDRLAQYRYPYESDTSLVPKISVSEIKRMSAAFADEETVNVQWAEPEKDEYVPEFAKTDTEEKIKGAKRGTIYHSLMEHINLTAIKNEEDIRKQTDELIVKGILPENVLEAGIISTKKILGFCKSPLAARMRSAQENGAFHAEQPFVMGLRANEIFADTDSEEIILVQGIIDAFFEEDNEIVLIDYKTDRILSGEEEKLVNRYRAQMECYRTALEKSTGKKVKEIFIYSFSLNKEISI